MSRQPTVLINFQKRETVFPAFIESSPLQTARIAEDSSAVQPVRFPAVYMAKRQIIDPLPPQGPKADRSRAACVRGAYVGVPGANASGQRVFPGCRHSSRFRLPVKHHNIKPLRIKTEGGMGGRAVLPCQFNSADGNQAIFSFRIGLPAGAEEKEIRGGIPSAVRIFPAALFFCAVLLPPVCHPPAAGQPGQAVSGIMVSPKIIEPDPRMRGDYRKHGIRRECRDCVCVKQVSRDQYYFHPVPGGIFSQTLKIPQQFITAHLRFFSVQMCLQP